FFQAEDGIRDLIVTGVQTCALPIYLGGKTEGLIPAAEFAETEIPRPDPNATIEVQRSGEHKDGYEIVSYQKVLRRRTWEKIEARSEERRVGKEWRKGWGEEE